MADQVQKQQRTTAKRPAVVVPTPNTHREQVARARAARERRARTGKQYER